MSPPHPFESRRGFLTAVGAATATTVSGCLDSTPASEAADGESVPTTGGSTSTDTEVPTTADGDSSTGGTPTAATSTDATPTEPPRDGPDPFYVENHRPADRCTSLSVRHGETGDVALDGTYAVPAARSIAFEAVGVVGESYDVEAELDTGERVSDTWEVRVCPPEFRGDGLNRAGVLRIEDGDVRFVTNQCDFVIVDRAETYEWDPRESACEI